MIPVAAFEPRDPDFERRVRESFVRQRFMATIGAELHAVRPGYCEIHVPYRKELTQQHEFFHAGVIGTVADTCGGYAAYTLMDASDSVLSVEYKLNLLSPGVGELLIGRGRVVKAGRTLTPCVTDLFVVSGGEEKLCATSLMTMIRLPGRADAPEAT